MPLYSLTKIERLARSRQIYLRGVNGYNAGWVKDFSAAPSTAYATDVTAVLSERGVDYPVCIGFDESGEVSHLECRCGGHTADGACKHIVAALVYKYYKDMLDDRSVGAALVPQAGAAYTDMAAQRLIDRYMTQESAYIAADTHAQVSTAAVLVLDGARPAVHFTLEKTTPYRIKNLAQFARRMMQGDTAEYGKNLAFTHCREAFLPGSLPLVEFLLGEVSERMSKPAATEHSDTLWLTPAGMDRFFTAAQGCAVTLQTAQAVQPLVLLDGEPPLMVTAQRQGDGVRFESDAPLFAMGVHTLYVVHNRALYRTGATYTRCMAAWMRAFAQQPQGIYVAPAALGAFCAGVLATVEPYIRLEGDTAALTAYRPQSMTIEIYLDAPQPDTVTAAVSFVYAAGTVAAFQPVPMPPAWRDVLAERRAEAAIQACFPHFHMAAGTLAYTADDENLFYFITDGVEALRRVGTVYATDAFERLVTPPPMTLSAGLSLAGDWLELTMDMDVLPAVELDGIITGYRAKKAYHRLKDGRFVRLDDGALAALAEMADTLGLSRQEWRSGRLSLPKYRAFTLERLLRHRRGVTLSRDEAFRALTQRLRTAGDREYPLPQALCGTLRDYQVTGYRWLRTMDELGLGGILADDMGLGKTVQVIALLLAAKQDNPACGPSLVVCPTSVVLGWKQELARFAPGLRVLCVTGDAATRRALLSRTAQADVLVTSYDMLKRDIEAYAPLSFRYHILDEAQYIKNSTTQNARAVKLIQATARFALTGTPMENRLSELWSILDFLLPGLLFSYPKFRARYEVPIMRHQDGRALELLRRTVEPFVLRRLKQDVLAELPPKTERVLPAPLDASQRMVYDATVQELRGLLRGGKISGHSRMTVLALLTRLRQICCDPRLCCDGYTGASGKLEACMELVREAADGGHKVLLFSQFTSMLALLSRRLEQEGIPFYLLQGSTPAAERTRLVEAFNADKTPVFLISLKAGGTGLNLTGADMVIHYDPWWNLSVQNQATDRAYRIGQKNPVQVVRLIAQDTVEERIARLQEDKRRLTDSVVGASAPAIESLSAAELLALLQ